MLVNRRCFGELYASFFSDKVLYMHLKPVLVSITLRVTEKKVKMSLLQAVEAPRVARGRGSHIT
jgi:hypothetical protein